MEKRGARWIGPSYKVSHLDVAQNEPAPYATSLLSVSLVEQGSVGATLCVRADEECIGVITYRTVAITSAIPMAVKFHGFFQLSLVNLPSPTLTAPDHEGPLDLGPIFTRRESRGLSQRQLAERASITHSHGHRGRSRTAGHAAPGDPSTACPGTRRVTVEKLEA